MPLSKSSSRLIDCTPARVAEYRDKLAAILIDFRGKTTKPNRLRSPATINRYLSALSYVFTVAVKEYGWKHVLKVARKKEAAGRTRFLSDNELVRLLNACRKSVNEHLYDVSYCHSPLAVGQWKFVGYAGWMLI